GKLVAYVDKPAKEQPLQLFLLTLDSLEKRALTSPTAPIAGDWYPAFSPDGQMLAFARYKSADPAADICVLPIAGGDVRQLTFDNKDFAGLDWTADGHDIIFSSNRAGPRRSLWRIAAAGGTPERLGVAGENAGWPCVSRKARRLAFVQGADGDLNIYRIELAVSRGASTPTKFASSTQLEYAPRFSPDGKKVAFESTRSGNHEVWVCDADGSNLIQLTSSNGGWAGTPRWSPNGREVVFDLARGTDRDI